jgi:hypothetical protein
LPVGVRQQHVFTVVWLSWIHPQLAAWCPMPDLLGLCV